jgi:hypothetical protein
VPPSSFTRSLEAPCGLETRFLSWLPDAVDRHGSVAPTV